MSLITGVAELAAVFRCSEESIRLWTINDGLPCLRRGSPGVEARYPLPECVAWLVERERAKEAENPREQRAEWLRVKTEREHLKFMKEAGLLTDVAGVQRAAFAVAQRVRDTMLLIPDRLAQRLAMETDPALVYAALDAEIRQALSALADGFHASAATDSDGDVRASTSESSSTNATQP